MMMMRKLQRLFQWLYRHEPEPEPDLCPCPETPRPDLEDEGLCAVIEHLEEEQQDQKEAAPPVQEPFEELPSLPSLPLEVEGITLAQLRECANWKDTFQFLFNAPDYSRLYILLRDSAGAIQQIEGKIPVIILDENRVAQLVMMLREALSRMRTQSMQRQALAPLPWPFMSPDTSKREGLVTSETTPSSSGLPEGLFLGEEEYLPDWEDNEDDVEDEENPYSWETDDGHRYLY